MNSTLTLDFSLDVNYLKDLAERYTESYAQAKPYPHIIIDNFLPESILENILTEFPQPGSIEWQKFNAPTEKKLASTSELQMGKATRLLLYELNSSIFLQFLEKLTGIEGIIPDPYFVGGGLHQIQRGGYLKIHADFNRHTKLKLDRRLNLLLYLNKNWQEEYGGHFEMWDTKMTKCEKQLLPIFNRCVIFSTTDFSFHGHPNPLTCPEGMTRKSLALYYYSNGRPKEEVLGTHTTLFKSRPGENLTVKNSTNNSKEFIKKLVPPILIDMGKALTKKQ